jgi:transposase
MVTPSRRPSLDALAPPRSPVSSPAPRARTFPRSTIPTSLFRIRPCPPEHCEHCGESLADAPVIKVTRRQVYELPSIEAIITEQRAERRRCRCGCETTAPFPDEAIGPACSGPNLRALVCYLVVRQYIPIAWVAELMRDAY